MSGRTRLIEYSPTNRDRPLLPRTQALSLSFLSPTDQIVESICAGAKLTELGEGEPGYTPHQQSNL